MIFFSISLSPGWFPAYRRVSPWTNIHSVQWMNTEQRVRLSSYWNVNRHCRTITNYEQRIWCWRKKKNWRTSVNINKMTMRQIQADECCNTLFASGSTFQEYCANNRDIYRKLKPTDAKQNEYTTRLNRKGEESERKIFCSHTERSHLNILIKCPQMTTRQQRILPTANGNR